MNYKEIYLLDFSMERNSLKTIEFQTEYDAERVAKALWKLFNADIQLLQIRTKFERGDGDDSENTD